AETVRELMQRDGDQIDVRAVFVVQAVIPARRSEAGAVVDVEIELRRDVGISRETLFRETIRERDRVPHTLLRRVREIADGVCRPCRREHAARAVAWRDG